MRQLIAKPRFCAAAGTSSGASNSITASGITLDEDAPAAGDHGRST
ncbi:MAG: hypothetical protein ACLUE1_08070 [Adlercreutzia equolifaciens]